MTDGFGGLGCAFIWVSLWCRLLGSGSQQGVEIQVEYVKNATMQAYAIVSRPPFLSVFEPVGSLFLVARPRGGRRIQVELWNLATPAVGGEILRPCLFHRKDWLSAGDSSGLTTVGRF
jgi:hypothetical protein